MEKRDFNLTSVSDLFYRSINTLAFNHALILIDSLLNKDPRVISFYNWPEFLKAKKTDLDSLSSDYANTGLARIRDQVVAHQDSNNRNNNFLFTRRSGIHENRISQVDDLLNRLAVLLLDYIEQCGESLSKDFFDVSDAELEISQAINTFKPDLIN